MTLWMIGIIFIVFALIGILEFSLQQCGEEIEPWKFWVLYIIDMLFIIKDLVFEVTTRILS